MTTFTQLQNLSLTRRIAWSLGFLMLFASPLLAVEVSDSTAPAAASSATFASNSVVNSTASLIGVTEHPDIFLTLTRSAYPSNELPTTADQVTPDMIQKFDARNAGEAIARQTSVQIPSQGELGSLSLAGMRGATSNQTLVLIDGRPVGGAALSASQDLSEIPVEQIDHIEILRGGASALYGPNAIGGVINIITKRATYPGRPISNLTIEDGSFGRQAYRLDAGSRVGPVDYFFFGDRQWESGFRDNSDDSSHNIGGNLGLSMGAAGKFLFDASSYHSDLGVPGQLFPDIPPNQFNNQIEKQAATPNARQVTDTNYLRTSYILPLPRESLMTLRLFGSQREVQFTNPDFGIDSDRHEQSKGGEAQFNLPLGLLVGGSFIRDRLDSTDHATPGNSFIASEETWGVFAQDTLQWERLTLIPSGRYDHNSLAGDTQNPRVQLIADATPWLRFSGSAGRSFRSPTLDDLFTPFTDFGGGFSYQGNPNLRPEKAWTYDAGFELHQDSASFKATYFRANITDLIQTTSDLAATTINVGQARRQGAELELSQVVNGYFRHTWNYTYLHNVGMPPGFDHMVALRLSPRHTANCIATLTPTRRWTIDNTLQYVSSQFEGNDESSTKIGDHFLWNTRVAYQLRQAELYVGVNDVINRRYEERGGFPLPGRTFFGGMALRMWG